ncbi:hypothetical protein F971_01494 [Acinetobacter vivianii]|uniref:Uncharacterized protein n=1 Tax=Acinetobacter vivianii TaxID=1776742 RepID=N8WB17_9GAMM|nr:hypothetical protein [Acinetobacter vivianii]ENU92512.1 hypothetical protein F971_01494 [Acinetobacter vivianii]
MPTEILIEGWLRVRLSDSKQADLPCRINIENKVVHVYDYQGNELKFNAGARFVVWQGKRWSY